MLSVAMIGRLSNLDIDRLDVSKVPPYESSDIAVDEADLVGDRTWGEGVAARTKECEAGVWGESHRYRILAIRVVVAAY
jgi:hypothetical protein